MHVVSLFLSSELHLVVAVPAVIAIELELKKLPIRLLLLVTATLVIREYGSDTSATFFPAKLYVLEDHSLVGRGDETRSSPCRVVDGVNLLTVHQAAADLLQLFLLVERWLSGLSHGFPESRKAP